MNTLKFKKNRLVWMKKRSWTLCPTAIPKGTKPYYPWWQAIIWRLLPCRTSSLLLGGLVSHWVWKWANATSSSWSHLGCFVWETHPRFRAVCPVNPGLKGCFHTCTCKPLVSTGCKNDTVFHLTASTFHVYTHLFATSQAERHVSTTPSRNRKHRESCFCVSRVPTGIASTEK